ncbi:flavin reductase family protein [Amycolatopsis acidiphila]|uniref:Flavin reductase n=1 Tax=Amycolatopsis acidiphila TaxID=715473 RepID=A0A558AGA0_9PSEU|nr:flavin reductase family protein [Amycolatopsis acidiphila]TVT23284.1 flavin reductase [Amycolatopsis acidiphila]UIJ56507.1 flavin reductase family protein [Amycolatopsis acidiphila]GHG66901.1 putative oxidoreductase [Amycolatopsis acidiphila]
MPEADHTGEQFHRLVGMLDYSMFIVTAAAGETRAGCLVGFAAQCSISPPRFMVWLSKNNHTFTVAERSGSLGVHLLSRNEFELARLFGSCTGFERDKFAECAWRPGPDGVPLLEDCPGVFVGEILQRHDTGDHVGLLLRPSAARAAREAVPRLTFRDVRDLDPGNEA